MRKFREFLSIFISILSYLLHLPFRFFFGFGKDLEENPTAHGPWDLGIKGVEIWRSKASARRSQLNALLTPLPILSSLIVLRSRRRRRTACAPAPVVRFLSRRQRMRQRQRCRDFHGRAVRVL